MFPLQAGQVCSLVPAKLIHVPATDLPLSSVMQPFGGVPMMPIQAMTQQVCYISHGYMEDTVSFICPNMHSYVSSGY